MKELNLVRVMMLKYCPAHAKAMERRERTTELLKWIKQNCFPGSCANKVVRASL